MSQESGPRVFLLGAGTRSRLLAVTLFTFIACMFPTRYLVLSLSSELATELCTGGWGGWQRAVEFSSVSTAAELHHAVLAPKVLVCKHVGSVRFPKIGVTRPRLIVCACVLEKSLTSLTLSKVQANAALQARRFRSWCMNELFSSAHGWLLTTCIPLLDREKATGGSRGCS